MYSDSLYSIQTWNRIFQLYISQYSNSVGVGRTQYRYVIKYNFVNSWGFFLFLIWMGRRRWSVDQLRQLITGLANSWAESDHCQSVCPLSCPNLSNSIGRSQARPHKISNISKTEWWTQVFRFYFTEFKTFSRGSSHQGEWLALLTPSLSLHGNLLLKIRQKPMKIGTFTPRSVQLTSSTA